MSKKKLLILSSYGGYGHIAAANTLQQLVGDAYDISVVYPIDELRLFGVPAGEGFYNWLLSNNLNSLTNWMVKTVPARLFRKREAKTTQLIERHLRAKEADLLISLIPFVNYPASEAARRCEIPFLLVTTDNDLTNWVYGLEKVSAESLRVTIGRKLKGTSSLLLRKGVPEEAVEEIGLPLRPNFMGVGDKPALRRKHNISPSKNVVVIMMGGIGSQSTVHYVKALLARSLNLHLLVCMGRNPRVAKKLKKIKPASGNIIELIPFTETIEEFLALSDLLITKPGPGSINEAYSLRLPILIDRTKPPLFWEQANIDLVIRDRVGRCIHRYEDAPDLVSQFLLDEQAREEVARAYDEIGENRFSEEIGPLIEEMVGAGSPGKVAISPCP